MKRIAACLLVATAAGCIRAPEIVLVDRATALEQQAAGSFDDLEAKLTHEAIAPQAVPLTPDQLRALGIQAPSLTDHTEMTDADRIDELLAQHCVGEGGDGTLVETPAACRSAADRGQAVTLIERANRARAQLWRWMHDRRPESSLEDLRRVWRKAHVRGVVCGGWIQRDDGAWEAKRC